MASQLLGCVKKINKTMEIQNYKITKIQNSVLDYEVVVTYNGIEINNEQALELIDLLPRDKNVLAEDIFYKYTTIGKQFVEKPYWKRISKTVVFLDGVRDFVRTFPILDFDIVVETPNNGKLPLQRDLVWSDSQKQSFIMAILNGVRVGNISAIRIWGDCGDIVSYQIIDGKQRLTTFNDFITNKFAIKIGAENLFYNDLPIFLKYRIDRFCFDGDLLSNQFYVGDNKFELSDSDKIDWFYRINFSGTQMDIEHFNKFK